MAALSRQGRGSLRFFTGGEAAGDRRAEGEEKKRIVDYLHEPDDGDRDRRGGGEEMEAGKSKRRDLCSSMPLSASSSDVSSTGRPSYSPRPVLSRWLLPLQKLSPSGAGGGGGGGGGGEGEAGSGLGRLVRFPMCYRKNKKKKEKEEKGEEKEVVGPSVSDVVAGNGTTLSVSSGI